MQSSGRQRRSGGTWSRFSFVLGWILSLASPAFGVGLAQLTTGAGNDTEAAWSPDGQRIVFQSDRNGTLDLCLLDVTARSVKPLVEGPGHAAFPAWSPDGKWIAYSYACFTKTAWEEQEEGYNLFLVPAEGGTPRRLTQGRHRDYSPTFSADGKTIWFSSDRGSKEGITAVSLYAVSVEGGEPKVVLRREGRDHAAVQASFAPDGRSLAYGAIAGFRDNWQIRLAHADDLEDGYTLTDAQGCFYSPRWSPTGTLLACTGFPGRRCGLGCVVARCTNGPALAARCGTGQLAEPGVVS